MSNETTTEAPKDTRSPEFRSWHHRRNIEKFKEGIADLEALTKYRIRMHGEDPGKPCPIPIISIPHGPDFESHGSRTFNIQPDFLIPILRGGLEGHEAALVKALEESVAAAKG